jgi:hypothetical protein
MTHEINHVYKSSHYETFSIYGVWLLFRARVTQFSVSDETVAAEDWFHTNVTKSSEIKSSLV